MGEKSITRSLEGVGPEIEIFLGPELATSVTSAIWAQKSRDSRIQIPFDVKGKTGASKNI